MFCGAFRGSAGLSYRVSRNRKSLHSLIGIRFTSYISNFINLCAAPTSRYQVYVSQCYDPYVNLSIEHYLLQKTPADSVILLFYVNRPCVVIGRNQNPWLEANLKTMRTKRIHHPGISLGTDYGSDFINPQLVRRRSGGGAVFHDGFNINYTVICPTQDFTRDKHVEMVVRALRANNDRTRVTERHDIVVDQGDLLPEEARPEVADTHETAYSQSSDRPPLKVSGSAYKLVRNRSLHHGTCLLNSPNLGLLSEYLRSPARTYLKARGVESVRSPVGNVYPLGMTGARELFQQKVMRAFATMYGLDTQFMGSFMNNQIRGVLHHLEGYDACTPGSDQVACVAGYLDRTLVEIPEINLGIEELRVRTYYYYNTSSLISENEQSPEWIYTQTPRFTMSSHPIEEDDRDRPPLPNYLSSSVRFHISTALPNLTPGVYTPH